MTSSIKATKSNAIATLISGLLIIGFQKQLSDIFEITTTAPFITVGGIIALFSLTMFIEIKKQRAIALLLIIIQDTLFVITCLFVFYLKPFNISNEGYLFIGLFSLPIIFFIIYQSIGVMQLDALEQTNIKCLKFKQEIKADKNTVWNVVSNIKDYHKVAPNIDKVKIISGEKDGMIRSCSHGKDSWTETCTLWDTNNQYSFEVNTKAKDYPFPFKYLKGNWKANAISIDISEIEMTFDFEYKKSFQNLFLHPILKWKFTKIGKELLLNWKTMIEEK